MNIVICHAGVSGYLSACWRELAERENVNLSIFVPDLKNPYDRNIIKGLRVQILESNIMRDSEKVATLILAEHPDVLVVPGWTFKAFNDLLKHRLLKNVRKLMAIDSTWEGRCRQLIAPLVLYNFVKRLDGVIVAGERGRQFARHAGFSAEKIFTSTYGCDYNLFNEASINRKSPWPKSFVYLGRYEPIKGLNSLMKAYQIYCATMDSPWPLHCYGTGALKEQMINMESDKERSTFGFLHIHDFVQPRNIPNIYAMHGVYILPSLREPWGVSLPEAAAAGLPCICSDKVSSGIDIVRHLYDGLVFPAGNVKELMRCIMWMHENYEKLPTMGNRALHYAKAYSPTFWADRMLWACAQS